MDFSLICRAILVISVCIIVTNITHPMPDHAVGYINHKWKRPVSAPKILQPAFSTPQVFRTKCMQRSVISSTSSRAKRLSWKIRAVDLLHIYSFQLQRTTTYHCKLPSYQMDRKSYCATGRKWKGSQASQSLDSSRQLTEQNIQVFVGCRIHSLTPEISDRGEWITSHSDIGSKNLLWF